MFKTRMKAKLKGLKLLTPDQRKKLHKLKFMKKKRKGKKKR